MHSKTNTPRFNFAFPNGLGAAQHEMDRWFQRVFGEGSDQPAKNAWPAPTALWEDEQAFHVDVDLPGVAADAVELVVHDGKLNLSYERKGLENVRVWHEERRYGKFERQVSLPETVDADSIQAEVKDGQLKITFAKKPEAQPKKIAVKAV
jgi:HSP20 family protein